MKKLILVFVFISAFVKAQLNPACFNPSNPSFTFNAGVQPYGTCTTDFNSDGKPDLAVANVSSNDVSILLGTGSSALATAVNYSVGTAPVSIAFADFNGDGKTDLVTANFTSNDVSIILGSGIGTFSAATNFSVGTTPRSVSTADFNGDGKMDLAVSNYNSNNVSILLGTGTGSFASAVNYSVSSLPYAVTAADFNNDGNVDIAVANSGANNVSILLGTGVGTFGLPTTYSVSGVPWCINTADYNNDGNADLVTGNSSGGNVSVLIGSGTGTFSPAVNYTFGLGIKMLTSIDLNADGHIDLAISGNSGITVLFGSSTGTFQPTSNYTISASPYGISSADFNSDGKLDLAIANPIAAYITIMFGGFYLYQDALSFPLGCVAGDIISADFNNDGNMDMATSTPTLAGISILLGTGTGSFVAAVNYSLGTTGAHSIANASDFNNDGNLDLVVSTGTIASILLGTGTGSFSPPINTSLTWQTSQIAKGDFNNDGNIDLATANFTGNNVSILLGNGAGSFALPISYPAGINACRINTNDFNGDGIIDIVIANNTSNNVSVLFGTGTGSFGSAVNYSVGTGPVSISSADFNGDGAPDIVTLRPSANVLSILINTGTGSFLPVVTYTMWSTYGPYNMAIEDFNGDSKLDIAVGNSAYAGISMFYGTGTGTFSFTTNYNTPGIGAPYPITSADFNNDGARDIAFSCPNFPDVFLFLNHLPSLSISPNTVCMGSSVVLNAGSAISYTWSTGANTNTISVSPIVNTTYSVTAANIYGCINSASKTITVAPIPTLSVTSGTICSGSNFTITPSGASTYTFSSGTAVVSPTINSTYSVTGTSSVGCVGSNTAVSSVTVNSLPIISVNSGSICSSESYTINPSGAVTYTISGVLAVVSPTISTTYTVAGTDVNNCTNTQTLSVGVNTSCVWPGDANSDGIADNLDILELGLNYTSTGGTRIVTSNLWQAFDAPNWVGTITSGKNLHHSDCNGDGIINQNDTLAVFINYGSTHPFKQTNAINPLLTIVPDQASVYNGQWGTASIFLGNVSNPINNINGVAYTLTYDNSLIEPDSVWLEYPTSFLNTTNTNLHFRKRYFTNGVLYTATTHTNNTDVSGNGKIAILHYKILSSLTATTALNIGISQANQSDASGLITPLTSGSGSLLVVGNYFVGIKENTFANSVFISPNPNSGIFNIHISTPLNMTENNNIQILNTLGQIVYQSAIANQQSSINIQQLTNGIYFVKVLEGNKVIGMQKIIKE